MAMRLCTAIAVLCTLATVTRVQTQGSTSSSSSSSSSSAGSSGGSGSSSISQPPNGRISMKCGIYPGGQTFWYKQASGGKMEVARDSLLVVSDSRYQLQSENGAYVLTINPTKESDSGVFMCESTSMEGMTYKHTFQVQIGEGSGTCRTAMASLGTIALAMLSLI